MKKEDKLAIIIASIIMLIVIIVINIIVSIDKNDLIVNHLYDIEIENLQDMNKYLIYDNDIIRFRDASRESKDDTNDYAITKRSFITYTKEQPMIKVYKIKYKNPIQEWTVNKNKGVIILEILVPAGTVGWEGENKND